MTPLHAHSLMRNGVTPSHTRTLIKVKPLRLRGTELLLRPQNAFHRHSTFSRLIVQTYREPPIFFKTPNQPFNRKGVRRPAEGCEWTQGSPGTSPWRLKWLSGQAFGKAKAQQGASWRPADARKTQSDPPLRSRSATGHTVSARDTRKPGASVPLTQS